MKLYSMAPNATVFLANFPKENAMQQDTKFLQDSIELSDDMVANLENYLPGGSTDDKEAQLLLDRITSVLQGLEIKLQRQGRELKPTEQYQQHKAAQQAVQAALVALKLYSAGQNENGV